MLVADQNDVGFITVRHFKRIGVDDFRSLDFEGVMRDASKFEIQKFHHAPPSGCLLRAHTGWGTPV